MNVKKFLSALLLVLTLSASCAYARISDQLALSDPRIAPFVETTKQQGAKFLPGRYAHIREITHKSNTAEKINAPSDIVLEIGEFNSENNNYPANFDVYGAENLVPSYMTFDTSGAVPVLKAYAADDNGNYKIIAEDYVVVIPEGSNHIWLLASVENGEIRYLFPINKIWFPENWYEGTWKANDGSTVTLENDTITSDGEILGSFIVSDSRIAIKKQDGTRGVIFALYNPVIKSLVMTFPNGAGDEGEVAEVYAKTETPKTEKPKQEFPKFPMPQPKTQINLEGVWQTYINNHQVVMQFQGNQYYTWVNGQPYEMGIFEINGNVISGTTNTGNPFRNTISLDSSGNIFTMTDSNNISVTYQKVQ